MSNYSRYAVDPMQRLYTPILEKIVERILNPKEGKTMKLSELTRRYRISLEDPQDARLADRDFREQIKGRHGAIYLWIDMDDIRIAIETEKALYQNIFAKLPWLKRQSWCVFTASLDRLNEACKLIRAYRRRQFTPEQREKQAMILTEARKKIGSETIKSGFQGAK